MVDIQVSSALLQELAIAAEKVLFQYKLGTSDLSKSIEFVYKDDQFVMLANDYFQNIVYGRKPHARLIPVEDLIKWMKKKGITPKNGSYNTVAYLIQQSIYRSGIKARRIDNPIVEATTEIITEDLANTLSEAICTEIANDLTTNLK